MKIEKMSEKQIKCSINKEDLSVRGLTIAELAYGTTNAKSLFDEILKQAYIELGFQSDDSPLIVEAIPLSSGNLILLVTKDMDPEELDTRFSKFSPDFISSDSSLIEGEQNADFPLWDNSSNPPTFSPKAEAGFVSFPEMLMEQKSEKNMTGFGSGSGLKAYSFPSLASICEFARNVDGKFKGEASVYKNQKKELYYLILDYKESEKEDFTSIQNLLSEYASPVKGNYATLSFIREHFEQIVKEGALTILAAL